MPLLASSWTLAPPHNNIYRGDEITGLLARFSLRPSADRFCSRGGGGEVPAAHYCLFSSSTRTVSSNSTQRAVCFFSTVYSILMRRSVAKAYITGNSRPIEEYSRFYVKQNSGLVRLWQCEPWDSIPPNQVRLTIDIFRHEQES